MANYVAAARSNHFRVKEEAPFLAWVGTLPGVSAHRDTPIGKPPDPADHPHPSYTLLADDGGWPAWREVTLYDFDESAYLDFGKKRIEGLRSAGVSAERLKLVGAAISAEYYRRIYGATDERDLDWAEELSPHLLEGEVAVLEEAGAEKLRYLSAHAIALNHHGEEITLDLSRIYAMAEEAGWGTDISEAAY